MGPVRRLNGWSLCAVIVVLTVIIVPLLFSCSRKLGWGVLLWSNEDFGIPSGAVLPVYVKSNIERMWVVGIPAEYLKKGESAKGESAKGESAKGESAPASRMFEIPLAQLDLVGGKGAAKRQAREFGRYARTYAETLQDGLPVRDAPDNGARRVYRLRQGEILKILSVTEGNPAVGATGTPLEGDWFRVLTEDGTRGYCFSYRLRLFEHVPGTGLTAALARTDNRDFEFEKVLLSTWVSDAYAVMLRDRKLDLEALSKKWRFTVGEDAGVAHVYAPDADRSRPDVNLSFSYSQIRRLGEHDWDLVNEEGESVLLISLLSETSLSVQYTTEARLPRTVLFASLPVPLDDLIMQETLRRDALWEAFFAHGADWRSAYYGRLHFDPGQGVAWSGYDRLVPQYIPAEALPTGRAQFSLYLDPALERLYDGALSIRFNLLGGRTFMVHFLYAIEEGDAAGEYGLRLEVVPFDNIENTTVMRRTPTPTVIFFYPEIANSVVP